ncbi:hypothetical protein C2845_PM10G16540 [Panicum miliaceum]|uniref:Uncharacterized protein n=1 Tax=Panicum miliaceum TaxID=4540 RepID=A0A3L6PAL9_PANMI|nr:hypothetical protein C2845_PM10G16540 [Panicum miliaceum]
MEVEQKPEAMEVDQVAAAQEEEADQDAVRSPRKEEVAATATKKITKKVRKVAKLAVQSLEMYYGDRAYRFLFDCVADFFADLLASDLKQLAPGGKKRKIGLATKWCPTPGSSFDRSTLLCEAIARRLFPRDSNPDYAGLSEEHYSYQVLHRLRREVLVPLRKVLELPEVYMSAQRWSELPYTRVASVAMRRYKALFKKHDEVRFGKYLEDVAAGKAKIAAGALLPHEIAAAAFRGEKDDVSELQWRRMVDDLRKKGSLSNCIAICDVSGSMSGTPIEVCVALGLLISELSEKPWAGKGDHLQLASGDPDDQREEPPGEAEVRTAHGLGNEHQLPGGVRPHPPHGGGRPAAAGEDDQGRVRVQRHGVRPSVGEPGAVGD